MPTEREATVQTQIEQWFAEENGDSALADASGEPFVAATRYIVMNNIDQIDWDFPQDLERYRDHAMTALNVLKLAYETEFDGLVPLPTEVADAWYDYEAESNHEGTEKSAEDFGLYLQHRND